MKKMKLNSQNLEEIARLTLDHYSEQAEEFWQGTRNHNVKQNFAALLHWFDSASMVVMQVNFRSLTECARVD
jgi:hypothetical protein